MNFTERIFDIEAVVRKFGFPVVVKSENVCPEKKKHQLQEDEFYQNSLKLPFGSITVLERNVTLEFAHVTVMGFRDQDKVMADKGDGYVEHHLEFEDDEFLLPLTYEGKCKIVHPPGKRKRYAAVAELIKDLPRWIRVNDQIVSVGSDSEDVKVIHVGEILEIIGVKKIETTRYLVCRNPEKQSVMINEDIPVNITAIDDTCTSLYTLKELIKSVYLPKCIEFEDVSPCDIVIYDDFWANHMLVMTGGPLQVNTVVTKDFILGWCIPVETGGIKRSLRTVLIPKKKWKQQRVKVRCFKSATERMQYTEKHFPGHSDSEYLNHKLYLMEATDYPEIVWLQNRQQLSEQPVPEYRPRDSLVSAVERPPPLPLEREELPESDLDEDYEEPIAKPDPGPPLPPRRVLLPERVEKQYYVEEEDLNQDENQGQWDPVARRPPVPLPEPPEETQEGPEPTSSDDESLDYDYPEGEEIRKLKKPYVGIDVLEAERVSLEGQTAESFYAYSIAEVVRCFKMVGLPDMAEKCEKEKINGKFFEGLSKEEVKMYFELEPLHFLKVKKAIFDGWRPR